MSGKQLALPWGEDTSFVVFNTFIHIPDFHVENRRRCHSAPPASNVADADERTLLECFPPQSVAVAPWPPVNCRSMSAGKGGTAVLRGFRPNEKARCADIGKSFVESRRTWGRRGALELFRSKASEPNNFSCASCAIRLASKAKTECKEEDIGKAIFLLWEQMEDGKKVKNVWFDLVVDPPQSHAAYRRDAHKEGVFVCLYYIGYKLKGDEQLRIISEPEHAADFREIFKQKGLMERNSKMVSILLSGSECVSVQNQLKHERMHLACDLFTHVEETNKKEETRETSATNRSKETKATKATTATKETKETKTEEKKVHQVFAIHGAGRHNSTMLIVGQKGISNTYAIGKGPHTGTPYQVKIDFLKNLSAKDAKDEVLNYWIFNDFDKIFQPGAADLRDKLLILYKLPDGLCVDDLLKTRSHDGMDGIQVVDLRQERQGKAVCVMPFPHPDHPEAPEAPEAPARRTVKVFVVGCSQLCEATLTNITDVAKKAATQRQDAAKASKEEQPAWRDEWYIPEWLEKYWKSKILPKYLEQAAAVSVLTINSRAAQRPGGAK